MGWVIAWISRAAALLGCLTLAWAEGSSGWTFYASSSAGYQGGLDTAVVRSGRRSAHISSTASANPRSFALYYQKLGAGRYRGQRVRLSGYIRTSGVSGWAGMWMRVDPGEGGPSLAFDNMQRRPIVGSTEWKEYSIELEVAAEAEEIHFGALLVGAGEVWFDDLQLTSVAVIVPGAAELRRVRNLPSQPYNLDFEADSAH